jgi:hypothetical protein
MIKLCRSVHKSLGNDSRLRTLRVLNIQKKYIELSACNNEKDSAKGLCSTESETQAHTNADKHQHRAINTSAIGAPNATAATAGAQSAATGDAAHARTVTSVVPRWTAQMHQPELRGILPNGTSPHQALVLKFSSVVPNAIGQHNAVPHGLTPD